MVGKKESWGKKGLNNLKVFGLFLFLGAFILLSLNFVFTQHTSTPTSMTINQSQYYIFNITLNNSNTGQAGNITQVNITLPSGFLFVANSNGSSINSTGGTYFPGSIATFTNTSTVLSWTNTTEYLINGSVVNSYFWFNATAQASLVPSGYYNITITSLNGTGIHQTNLSVKVNDINAPVISLITPTSGNATTPTSVTFSFNVTDDSTISNCSLILNGAPININNSGTNRTGGTTSFVNISYIVSNTWNINCTDIDNNRANSSTQIFSLLSFEFNGTTKDENGVILNNSIVNVTIRSQQGFSVLAYTSGTSNASGWFNFSIASNASWMYEPSMKHSNITTTPNFVDFKSKTIPAFPSQMILMLAGTNFYLAPAGTINLTAINASGGRTVFQYQIKDTNLGYPIAEDHTNWVTEANVYVPKNRNYSIMIYPNQSMPVSFNWNNFSSTVSYNLTGSGTNPTINASKYLVESSTLHKQFNMSMTMTQVTGYIVNSSGAIMNSTVITWTNFTIIPYLLEPGNMIHSEYGDMPYNLSSANQQQSDSFNLTSGFFNLSLPATAESSTILLFASVLNGSNYYGGFKNISLTYGTTTNSTNITIFGLLGTAGNITMDRIDGGGSNIAIPTAKQSFNLVNVTNSTLSQTSAHVETTVDYSSSTIGALEFTWMSDVAQSSAATFSIPLLNVTGIKEMNVYASGGPGGGDNGQYAPKRVSTQTVAQIIANGNITIKKFSPEGLDGTTGSSISIALYISNSSCDVPNPASSCLLGSSQTMANFEPIKAVMGGGKISFRMGTGNILIHYVNVDMLASGPPDVLFDTASNTNGTSGSSFASALRFGSQGPTIYDYALISMPYSETAGSGLNESAQVNITMPLLYDDNWNVIWNTTANGSASGALAGNYSHYSTRQSEWGNLTIAGGKTCSHVNVTSSAQINATEPCHIDNSSNRIWVRIPHFSGTGPSVSGSVLSSASTTTTTTTTSTGGVSPAWTSTFSANDAQFTAGYTKELAVKNRMKVTLDGETHYVGVVGLTSTTATINVSSTPQQATLAIGDVRRFEVSNDSFYDIKVVLNGIANNKANVTIQKIHEEITAETIAEEEQKEDIATGEQPPITPPPAEKEISIWLYAGIIVAIILVAVILFSTMKKKRRYLLYGY